MKTRIISLLALSIVLFALLNACRHEILNPGNGNSGGGGGTGGGGGGTPTATCSPDTAYFVKDIMPIIASNCTMSGCHDNITHAEGVNLTTYNNIMKYVVAGNAANSKLYKVIIKTNNDRMPPPPMPPLTAAQKALIQKWINQGAKNNNCTADCDTTIFTFSGGVKPMIDSRCVGCHNPASLGGNIDLSTYNAVKISALTGKLYNSIAHQSGYSPMPKNSAKLSDCEITRVQKWIAAGSLNN
jgi:uncharacterized membrane protein